MTSSLNRMFGIVLGALFLLLGLLGFTATGNVGFVATEGGLLLGTFEVNPLLNVVYMLLGAALLIGGVASVAAAKMVNGTVGGILLLMGIIGFFVVGTEFNYLALNTADHVLNLVTGAALLGVALAAERHVTPAVTTAGQKSSSYTSDTE
ncbi:DUF4383 domain-containing protein [Cryobacterium sp. TMT3-29-2]|uniref:DUF4383 domain-containing protein n=1 Tax=Cryobacterium sp. TMT3-29-2 TaxID=2555867 RepID=UPI001074104C|nr:DUF4383 domain-containing protein [Cryobacterium sp. TMT3-29-2]TFC91582.1 DUF4383 domain-containing protein [Cryobacterium sp. TMT3-29-2]